MTLVEFLTARLDEDEATARNASPGPWHLNAEEDEVLAVDDIEVMTAFALSGNQLRWTARHIAAHDPAAVLADIAAKRGILELHHRAVRFQWAGTTAYGCATCRDNSPAQDDDTWPCGTILALASQYGEHPEHAEEWKS